MTQSPPGWYPDPADPSRQRYFDGTVWTENYAPFVAPPTPAAVSLDPPAKQWNWKFIGGLGAVVLVLLVVGSLTNDDKKDTASSSSTRSNSASASKSYSKETATAAMPSGPSVAPAGSSVRDGKFEFQVVGVERGATSVPDAFGPEIAKGEFFVVKLRVTNVGDEARSFSATNQKLIIDGNEYKATSIMDKGWMEDINPGLGIEASAVFDIPPGAVPSAIECHDSMFSGGARVAL